MLYVSNCLRIESARLSKSASSNQKDLKKKVDNRQFKLNILYQIRSITKKKPVAKYDELANEIETSLVKYRHNRFSPINNEEHLPRMTMSSQLFTNFRKLNIESILESPILSTSYSVRSANPNNSWKSDMRKIYADYSIVSSPSYLKSAVPVVSRKNSIDSQSGISTFDFTKSDANSTSRTNSAFAVEEINDDEQAKSQTKRNIKKSNNLSSTSLIAGKLIKSKTTRQRSMEENPNDVDSEFTDSSKKSKKNTRNKEAGRQVNSASKNGNLVRNKHVIENLPT